MKRKYHGWIIAEDGGPGFKDSIHTEWQDEQGRHQEHVGYGNSGCAKAVEWWDEKVGGNIKLEPLFQGSYRVYTEVAE